MITRKITLKEGTTEKHLIQFSNWLEKKGKFLASGQGEDGKYYIICRFDDEIDFKAFLVFLAMEAIA